MNYNLIHIDDIVDFMLANGYNNLDIKKKKELRLRATQLLNNDPNVTPNIRDYINAYYNRHLITRYYYEDEIYNMSFIEKVDLGRRLGIYNIEERHINNVLRFIGRLMVDFNTGSTCDICLIETAYKDVCNYCMQEITNGEGIENILNRYHSTSEVNINKIVIHTGYGDGYGDIIFGIKLYLMLKEYITPNIVIVTPYDMEEKYNKLMDGLPVFNDINDIYDTTYKTPDFLIYAPRYHGSEENVDEGINANFNVIIDEYNLSKKPSRKNSPCFYQRDSGLNIKYSGIFIDRNPARFNLIKDDRLRNFYQEYVYNNISFVLYTSGLNYLPAIVKTTLLFHNYGFYGTNSSFIQSGIKDSKRLVYFISGDYLLSSYNLRAIFQKYRYNCYLVDFTNNVIFAKNFNHLKYYDPVNEKEVFFVNISFNYEDMQYLIGASNPLILINGDQSLSDAVSWNKRFIYDNLEHKSNLNRELHKIIDDLNLVNVNFTYECFTLIMENMQKVEDYNFLTDLFNAIYNNNDFAALNDFIMNTSDITFNIIGLLKRYKLYLTNPQTIQDDKNFLARYLPSTDTDKYFANLSKDISNSIIY